MKLINGKLEFCCEWAKRHAWRFVIYPKPKHPLEWIMFPISPHIAVARPFKKCPNCGEETIVIDNDKKKK